MDQSELNARLIAYVAEHGPSVLLSPRARKEQAALQARLQAILDGPILPKTSVHSALLREGTLHASH